MNPATDLEWTPEQCAELTKLWASGLSGAEIARRMGTTKNAIVGKARRLDLPRRWTPPAPPRAPEPITLDQLNNNTCAWPLGNPKDPDFKFCGMPTGQRYDGRPSPYCQDHTAIAYQPYRKRGEAANDEAAA